MKTKATLTNIEKFKNFHLYNSDGRISKEDCKKLGLSYDNWESLDNCAYQAAYDISNDWAKEIPEWKDVQEGYKMGAEDGINYAIEKIKRFKIWLIGCYADADEKKNYLYKDSYNTVLNYLDKLFKEDFEQYDRTNSI